MKQLRKRLDITQEVVRAKSQPLPIGKWVYFFTLGCLLAGILNYFLGPIFLLRAEGMMLTERYVVDATYPARVKAVHVKEGDVVAEGDILLELESAGMLRDIADLAARQATISTRYAELRSRREAINALRPIAQRHAQEAETVVSQFDKLGARIVTSVRMDQALSSRYTAQSRLVEMEAEERVLAEEEVALQSMQSMSTEAITKLNSFYDGGLIRAATDGIVGAKVPLLGEVVEFGDELMRINRNSPYVLAYVPESYLFDMKEGKRVLVKSGSRRVVGRIESVLLVADALPDEFQNMFRPRDRSRLVRVRFEEDVPFAVTQKVKVRSCMPVICS